MALVRLAAVEDLAPGSVSRVELDEDAAVALVRTADGVVRAVEDNCSHQDYPLSDGWVEDCMIECSLHGSRFNLETGLPDMPPATRPVRVFPAKVDGDDVLVELPDEWAELAPADWVRTGS